MSLQVWLPLNGTLENKGLATLTSSGTATYKTGGKLGTNCFNLNSRITFTCSSLANKTIFSIAFWAKVNDDETLSTDWVDIIGFNDVSTGGTTGQLRWETCYSSTNKTRGISGHDNTVYAITQYSATSGTYPVTVKNIWEHRVFTVSATKCSEYINGELKATYNVNGGHLNGTFWIGQAGVVNGELQDVRIYDNILSETEIKKLSQGLVVHLPLNNNGLGQENLVTGVNTGSTETNKWYASSSVGGNTSTIEQDETGTYCVKITRNDVEQSSWDFLFYPALLRNQIKTSTTYTVSFDCKPSVTGTINLTGFLNTNATNYMTNSNAAIQNSCTANEWNHMVYRCTTIASFDNITISTQGVYFSRSASLKGTNVTLLLKNLKVEEGNKETPWCPAFSDYIGQNLLVNTDDLTKWNKESGVSVSWDSTVNMYKMVVDKTNNTSRWGIYQDFIVRPNTTYTFTVEGIKGDHTTCAAIQTYETTTAWPTNRYTFTTSKTKGTYTFTTSTNEHIGRVYLNLTPTPDTGNKTAWFSHPKLEIGSTATSWTPTSFNYPSSGPGVPQNLLSGTSLSILGASSTSYLFSVLKLNENLQAGKTYTLQLWNVNVSHSAKTAEQTGVWVYWGGGNCNLFNWAGSTYFTDGHADYLSKTFTVTESQANTYGAWNAWLNLYNSVPSVAGTMSATVEKWKLEESSSASEYTPAPTDANYITQGYNDRLIFDQSGYNNNGIKYNITYTSDTPKYNVSAVFDNNKNACIKIINNNWMVQGATDMTINVWAYMDNWSSWAGRRIYSCTQGGGFNLQQDISGQINFPVCVYTNSTKTTTGYIANDYRTGILLTNLTSGWHMFTHVYNTTGTYAYLDGVLVSSKPNTTYGIYFNKNNSLLFLGAQANQKQPASPYFMGKESDFRIYYTTLSDKDILSLYNNTAYIDSNNNIYGQIRD